MVKALNIDRFHIRDEARPMEENPNMVKCPDGTWDVNNGIVAPCLGKTSEPVLSDSKAVVHVQADQEKQLSDRLLGSYDGFEPQRIGNLLLWVGAGAGAGFFLAKPLKTSRTLGAIIGSAVIVSGFALLNAYEINKSKNKK